MRYLIGSIICSTLLFAQSETLVIDAQDFQADDKKGVSIFTGNVKIKMGQDKLNANRVDVFFTTNKENKKVPLRYEAMGNADFEIVTEDKHYIGNGDKIIYSPQKEEYTIIGNGFLQEKNDDRKVYGDTIFVNQITGEAKVKGNENKPVRFIINVDRGEDKGKNQ
ncbi:lipopolysaccharide transport periplasmic protein LptA [Arcobacter aquimarinus]|uniref:Lipooligosaccharide transport system, periplasmic component LptA n=1 Tax=Arcobacter aquimarinus TaxID=1315211 RepID=A0AAE7B4T6_9BACT|nr:lipopolysaccharide transport periplasmic protein LptA [Arcobacter aquimarinus]QKE25832.1 lipooligosaccharide transport system, periplasmic component LptA [Arcobacter aquimarinus]RXI35664.1 lipopolysaccharide transport periplasmic protein LptA [Arcobacter aquimarinus]